MRYANRGYRSGRATAFTTTFTTIMGFKYTT